MNPPKMRHPCKVLSLKQHLTTTTLLLLGLLHDLLDDLLLLDEEGADDAVTDAVGATGATVGTLDGLLGAGDLGVLARAEGGDTRELDAAVTALGGSTPLLDVKVPVLATGGPDNADLVGDRVVRLAAPVGKSGVGHCVGIGRRVWSVIGRSLVVNPSQSLALEFLKLAAKAWSAQRLGKGKRA